MSFQKCLSHPSPMAITTLGVEQTIQGSFDIGEGHALQGVKKTLIGLTATNLGARWMSYMPQDLMKYSLCTGAGAVSIKGVFSIIKGIKQKNAFQIIKGASQAAMGCAQFNYIINLDSNVILVAHQASVVAMSSLYISKSGLNDLSQGSYKKGTCKILLGIGGLSCAGYYVYNEMNSAQRTFIAKHEFEIAEICKNKITTIGDWTFKNHGSYKFLLTHPEMPNVVVKFPKGWDDCHCPDSVRKDYAHLQSIRNMASEFSNIVVPQASLVETEYCPILIEEDLNLIEEQDNLVDYDTSVPESLEKEEAVRDFYAFIEESGLEDVVLGHNAGFIKNNEATIKIGVFDFDHIGPGLSENSPKVLFGELAILAAIARIAKILTLGTKLEKQAITQATKTTLKIIGYIVMNATVLFTLRHLLF